MRSEISYLFLVLSHGPPLYTVSRIATDREAGYVRVRCTCTCLPGLGFTVTSMSGKRVKSTQLDRYFKSGASDSGYTTQDMEFSQSQTSATPTSGSALNKPAASGAMNIVSGAGKR